VAESGETPEATRTTPSSGVGGRDSFTLDELAVVLSHYDVGLIESVQEFPRGSRKAPKLLLSTEQGKFLLKRRAKGRDDPYKVALCHAIQLQLASRQFPLPHLIGTRKDNNSMLQLRGAVYELFEYIPGQGYPQTLEATADSGRVLGLFHKLLEDFNSPWPPPTASYHRSQAVESGLKVIPTALGSADAEIKLLAQDLHAKYRAAADEADKLGLPGWPGQITHADWHPGNMLYRENHVVAVIDYDSARLLPRVIDAANGALQFSIIGGDEDVARWPDHLDESRFKRFLRGYDGVKLLAQSELAAVPALMAEALIAEAVIPIAATGQFGRLEGIGFLKMVQRKAAWLSANAARLTVLAAG
jgi:Ser/Thr protein kinase RdoA (MazF antagonist)